MTGFLDTMVMDTKPAPNLAQALAEAGAQLREVEGKLLDAAVACIGGGSNAMGLFHPFLDDHSVRLIGVEAGGHGIESGEHAASLERR